jgi:SAM-dependent methyltransferase
MCFTWIRVSENEIERDAMLKFERDIIEVAESLAAIGEKNKSLAVLRSIGLEAYGEVLWSMPNSEFRNLTSILPEMASEQVQRDWTGCSGKTLLNQTVPFVRYMLANSNLRNDHVKSSDWRVLDYGCGYGRITRLLSKYLDHEQLFGVDAWEESLKLIHSSGYVDNFKKIDEVPESLPFELNSFNLIWAFSVFTHLSPRVAQISLSTISKYLKPEGRLVITLRPIEYWDMRKDLSNKMRQDLKNEHYEYDCSFLPHNREPWRDFGVTYGDSTLTLKKLEQMATHLQILDVDRTDVDPFQIYVTLKNKT